MTVRIMDGDCREVLKTLPDDSVHCVVTSPPYFGLRDYGVKGQIGLEDSPDAFVMSLLSVFAQLWRVLRSDGTVWLNLGDSYASKDLIGIPWLVALALQEEGWWLRQDIIWHKPNPMPESVSDRCTKAHEYIFMLSKSARYFYDAEAIKEPGSENSHGGTPNEGGAKQDALGQHRGGRLGVPAEAGRNKRSVWNVATTPFHDAHFATFPPALIEPCILAGCPEGGTVLDPFGGAGTTGLVADRHKRNAILIEINPEYADMARKRIFNDAPLFADVA